MRHPLTITSGIGRWSCWLLTLLAVLLCGDEVRLHGIAAVVRALPAVGLVLCVCWGMWGLAGIRLDDTGVRVDNPLRWTHVPWRSLDAAEVEWGLVLCSGERRIRAAAAPLRGAVATALRVGSPAQQQLRHRAARAADRPLSISLDAATAAALIQEVREQALVDDGNGATGAAGKGAGVTNGWHVARLVVVALLVATGILALVV